ncbi:bifunctional diaminohydroxyphosphoribosylaminopyrimidine deaminase/5-amino-6-(5-phosphoribosylamino)uracil reductase RibD [Agromyces aerolatus]|uniref:bifunctional diaminohydroxyphosphoribosylaminopyrimidine deaminase/5-amino-6-(5-phosphoribosylamino)uracil reductase RibD n=1 Tax=Agromyces sp. LY-1074 TaxID=3074080 RepID=UPI00285D423C|nr:MULTISPECIES: bifunctional diaminohydroxyphosphoribosylaminopyrimidine deaminase/5-amino-6-(5-phosphoribosylamino)uracil reductase RibD [unclassified Agromyces]MDR5700311.1 bifunctional diaminohydroxyphosphoribosylaminopyrimidine deaminase/5-amino-6-(5-phosphoribosylamino)uracil reductase RibD [Agromyces sp. LY-1074]MDR5706711.1 bifunctional diaminohydroxyphosphoribosylaminopyrimidine deaminase/5-amino-6-(5-phosphoribosylamino)uracil reductase RibD [Agromyces sp. LY-1358]
MIASTARTATAPTAEGDAMLRALELATLGPAHGVNPRVGCLVLAPDGRVLAEGWHRGAGTAHAEVDALGKLAPGQAAGATAVVTLEPCNHTGRTGPCSEALIEAGVARVVYAVADPGARSSGGAERLRAAGVEVVAGVLADEVEAFLADWLFAARHGRPRVTVKWASTLDGRAAAADGSSQWITGPAARSDVHRRRAGADAIAVGTGTLLADDPALTARDGDGALLAHQPVPVVFGRRAVPAEARLSRHPQPVIQLEGRELGADLATLHTRGIRSLFVEGGPTLASAFLAAGLADELLVYLAPALLGGPRLAIGDLGVPSIGEALRFDFAAIERLGDDLLVVANPVAARAARDTADPTEGN